MLDTIEAFDEIYAVSDLHIGGKPGTQLFDDRASDAMVRLCDHIASRAKELRVAFVINGDVFDFLAEDGAVYCDGPGIVGKLEAIAARPHNARTLDAWQRLVGTAGCAVVFVLGNHDIELALPWARSWLHRRLGAGAAQPSFAVDGSGFRATVGGRLAYLVHGNDLDDWNFVDHDGLRRVDAAAKIGAPLPAVRTNQGTRLVVDLMNRLKARYPFVDQLKPERGPVLTLLLALDDRNIANLPSLAAKLFGATAEGALRKIGLLSDDDESAQIAETPEHAARLIAEKVGYSAASTKTSAAAIMRATELRFQSGKTVRDGVGADGSLGGTLGDTFAFALRPALEFFLKSTQDTFSLTGEDEMGDALTAQTGTEVTFLLAGHTHLRRAKPRPGGIYFNSGTWAKLMRMTPSDVPTPRFDDFIGALTSDDAPDRATKLDAFTVFEPTVVVVRREGANVKGFLAEVRLDAADPLQPISSSEHVVAARDDRGGAQ